MEKHNDEQTKVTAQNEQEIAIAEKEQDKGANSTTVSLGKFKDANALLEAYNNLQAEFTKRCQRVKELESIAVVDKAQSPTQTAINGDALTGEEKDEVLKNYLKELLARKQKAIVLDGAGVGAKTPTEHPKTFEQAGQLAKEILKKHL